MCDDLGVVLEILNLDICKGIVKIYVEDEPSLFFSIDFTKVRSMCAGMSLSELFLLYRNNRHGLRDISRLGIRPMFFPCITHADQLALIQTFMFAIDNKEPKIKTLICEIFRGKDLLLTKYTEELGSNMQWRLYSGLFSSALSFLMEKMKSELQDKRLNGKQREEFRGCLKYAYNYIVSKLILHNT